MTNEPNPVTPQDPSAIDPESNEQGVQLFKAEMTQVLTSINAPDAIIPSGAPTERSEKQVEALQKEEDQEAGFHTTDGYVIDEAGMLNNFAIEPPMYIEGEEPKT